MRKIMFGILGIIVFTHLSGCGIMQKPSEQVNIPAEKDHLQIGESLITTGEEREKEEREKEEKKLSLNQIKKLIPACDEITLEPIKNIRKFSDEVYDCQIVAKNIVDNIQPSPQIDLQYKNNKIVNYIPVNMMDYYVYADQKLPFFDIDIISGAICREENMTKIYSNILSGKNGTVYYKKLQTFKYPLKEFQEFISFLNNNGNKLSRVANQVYGSFLHQGLIKYQKNGTLVKPINKPILNKNHQIFYFENTFKTQTGEVVFQNIYYIDGKYYHTSGKQQQQLILWEIIGLENNELILAYTNNVKELEKRFPEKRFPEKGYNYDIIECKLKL